MRKSNVQVVAHLLSDIGSPSVLATLFLVGQPLLHQEVPWGHAMLASMFVTIIPTMGLIVMRKRGAVSDRHVTQRAQRAPVMILAGLSILVGFAVLGLVHSPPVLFQEVAGVLLGLIVCFVITRVWKVSIHVAVGTYVALAATAPLPLVGPVVALALSSAIGWSRVRISHHTPSQVLAGQLVGCAVYLARVFFLLGL